MKKALPYLAVEIAMSLMIALAATSGSRNFVPIFGLINLILAVIGLLSGVFFSIVKSERIAKPLLISSSLLLLMGFLTCTTFYYYSNT